MSKTHKVTIDSINYRKPKRSIITALHFIKERTTKGGRIKKYVLCQCDCGKQIECPVLSIQYGKRTSCGCLRSKSSLTHGLSKRSGKHPLYTVWYNMIARCYNPKNKKFNRYGGRGINICSEWKNSMITFYNWGISNGWKVGLQIDRIDNNGNYSPDNCRFISQQENKLNKENTLYLSFNGERLPIKEWAKRVGIRRAALVYRIRAGWNIEKALSTIKYSNHGNPIRNKTKNN